MICWNCGNKPQQSKCEYCGSDPVLRGTLSFRIDEPLGDGATHKTWRGTELAQNWPVAIKEIPLGQKVDAKRIELAHREATVLQQLQHPGIPRYIDHTSVGEGKTRRMYLVTELITGVSLAEEVERHRYSEDEVLDILEDVLGILRYLHGLMPPVIHRDLKPSNVFRRQPGNRLVLTDFGSVRDALKDPQLGGNTVAGTFGYMAPEQFGGDASPKSDLYGLGALAVRLLSRREPHKLHGPDGQIRWEKAIAARPSTRLLLTGLLDRDPSRRIDAQQARQLIKAARKERRADDGPTAIGEPAPPKAQKTSESSSKPRPRPKPKPRPRPRGGGEELPVPADDAAPATLPNYMMMGVFAAGGLGLLAVSILGAAAILFLL